MAIPIVILTMTNSIAMVLTPALAQTELQPGPEGPSVAVANIVTGIVSYSRWPEARETVRVCIAGQSAMTARIASRPLIGGRHMVVLRRPGRPVSAEGCDAIFLADSPLAEQRRLLQSVNGRPILTLSETGSRCTFGVMFCIRPSTSGGLTFDLDIDAVSRSRIRVDPRVLSLGRRAVAQ